MPQVVPIAPPTSNRHRVDRLGDIREEMKTLKAEADEVRETVLENPNDLNGDDWHAFIKTVQPDTKYDIKAIVRHFGKEALAKFTIIPDPYYLVSTKRVNRAKKKTKIKPPKQVSP
jgi:hypothetical protein